MKKLHLLMTLLLSLVGATAFADDENTIVVSDAPSNGTWADGTTWYHIQNGHTDGYHPKKGYWSTSIAYVTSGYGLNTICETEPVDDYGLWCIVGNDNDGYQFYNKGEGPNKVLGIKGDGENAWMSMYDVNTTTDGVTLKFDKSESNAETGCYCFKIKDSSNDWLNNRDETGTCHFGKWNHSASGPSCGGSAILFTKVDISDYIDVTYNYTFGTTKTSITIGQKTGTAPVCNYTTPTYGTITYKTDNVSSDNATVDVYIMPFKYASTYDDLTDDNWYTLTLRVTNYWKSSDGESVQCSSYANAELAELPESSQWAFVGNTTEGFKIYNKGAGSSKSFDISDGTGKLSADGSTFQVSAYTVGDVENGFCLAATSGTNKDRLNEQGNAVKTWSGVDKGSAIVAILATDIISAAQTSYLNDWKEVLTAINNLPTGTVGAPTDEQKDALSTACANNNYADAKSAMEALQKRAAPTVTEGYYRLLNSQHLFAGTMRYLAPKSDGGSLIKTLNSGKAVSTVVKITPTDAEGKYTLSINGKNIGANPGTSNEFQLVDPTTGTPGTFSFSFVKTTGLVNIAEATGDTRFNVLHSNGGDNEHVVCWEATSANYGAGSGWFLVKATDAEIALNPATFNGETSYVGTAYVSFDATTPDGAKAYLGSTADDSSLKLKEGTVIPAGQGVILSSSSTPLTINISDTHSEEVSTLTGTYFPITLSDDNRANYLVFGLSATDNSTVGLFKPSSSVTQIPMNKAYWDNSSSQVMQYTFNFDQTTAISNLIQESTTPKGEVYDLSGRRVASPVKGGIYIQNGKKFVK